MTVPATTKPSHDHRSENRRGSRAAHHHEAAAEHRSAPWALPPGAAALDPRLLEMLRCPLTGGALIAVDADRLMSDRPFRDGVHPVYPVVHGIPCLRTAR